MNDQELQLALAKMLPEKIFVDANNIDLLPRWRCGTRYRRQWPNSLDHILDTEWLHVCWLIEQKMAQVERTNYYWKLSFIILGDSLPLNSTFLVACASWQQRAEAILKVKGATT